MKTLIKIEEAALFCLAVYLYSTLGYAWWIFLALLLLPDISMLGYIAGNRIGAIAYNLFHHRGLAVIVYLAGIYLDSADVALAGVILFAHSSMDRMFGYGLKYESGFRFTHLGTIGKQS